MKLFSICILTTFSAIVNGQISISNLSLTDSTLPYLYIGIDNEISISGIGYVDHQSSIYITGGGGMISKVGANKCLIRVSTITDECRVNIQNKKTKKIVEKVYKVRVIYLPEATLNGHHFDTVSKQELLLFPLLNVIIPKSFWRHNYRIISFEASFISNGDSIKISTQGNRFSKEQITQVRELNPGDEIYFDQIRCLGPDSRTIKLPSFWIRIK